ncbi:MAG: hypothetical protein ABIH86_02055 [Planctomycetota bacterium]
MTSCKKAVRETPPLEPPVTPALSKSVVPPQDETLADIPFAGVLSDATLEIPAEISKITAPMKVDDYRGVSYVTVPESEAGENFYAAKTGLAEFRFKMETDGEVWVWFRRWWDSSCADMFYFSIGDARATDGSIVWIEFRATPENFRQWTWSRARRPIKLPAGDHVIRLTNGNDGWRVDTVMLTRDPGVSP